MVTYKKKLQQVPEEIREKWLQEQDYIKTLIIQEDKLFQEVKLIAGCDISFSQKFENVGVVQISILQYPELKVVKEIYDYVQLDQPYIPGFLSFREAGHLVKLFQQLKNTKFYPDLIMVDGNGLLHKNKCGLACHLGVLLDLPSIGVAKSFFSIENLYEKEMKQNFKDNTNKKGDFVEVKTDQMGILGAAIKPTDQAQNPIYVSVGHRISLNSAIKVVLKCCQYKIPEPIRVSDLNSRQIISKLDKLDNLDEIQVKQNEQIMLLKPQ